MRSPLLRFTLAGALLFGLQRWWSASGDVPPPLPIVVAERGDSAATDAAIENEVLLREALVRRFDENDKVVRERLVRVGRFLGLAAGGDDDAVEREARTLGLQRTDTMIRRYLVGMMRLAATQPGPQDLPDESALRAYYEEHAERYAQPVRTRLTHVYLSADRRGAELESDAATLLARLRTQSASAGDSASLGDAFARGATLSLSAAQIDQVFGPGFAAALAEQPQRAWVGPLRSSYGLHLVWIDETTPAAPLPLAAVRSRVVHEMLADGAERRLREKVRALRAAYDVRVAASHS